MVETPDITTQKYASSLLYRHTLLTSQSLKDILPLLHAKPPTKTFAVTIFAPPTRSPTKVFYF